jgi:hypothetical protein
MRYRTYIASDKWRNNPVRLAELAEAKNRCRICFDAGTARSPLEVHHATYRRLGREIVGDLIALCGLCQDGPRLPFDDRHLPMTDTQLARSCDSTR